MGTQVRLRLTLWQHLSVCAVRCFRPHGGGDDGEHPLQEAEVDLVPGHDAGQTGVALQQLLVDAPAQGRRCLLLRRRQRRHQVGNVHLLKAPPA